MSAWLKKNQGGQGLVEYALIIMLVALIVIIVLVVLGPGVGNLYSSAVNALP
ncbi:MAG: pilus assembly protein [Chloroflexi bacterium]|nr:pilus assembly protein [Chloroflexota bacterium]